MVPRRRTAVEPVVPDPRGRRRCRAASPRARMDYPTKPVLDSAPGGLAMRLPLLAVLAASLSVPARAAVQSPSEFLGFTVGADRTLADYRQISRLLAGARRRVAARRAQVLGKTTLGEDMFMAVISSEENLANLAHIKEAARRLADPRGPVRRGRRPARRRGQECVAARHVQHPLDRDRRHRRWRWSGRYALATAQDAETRRRLERRRAAARALAQPGRPDHGDASGTASSLGTALRGRPHALALPPLRRATTTTATGSCSRRRRRAP